MNNQRIVVIGAAGEMCSVAVERFCKANPGYSVALYDLDLDGVNALAAKLPRDQVDAVDSVDLFDQPSLRAAVRGAGLVVLGAGPYMKTAEPVMAVCAAEGVDYLDFDDDNESTLEALEMDARAKEAGVTMYVGCGASPGMTNVIARDVADQLDEVEAIDVCWVTGDEGARAYGRAVIEHLLHIAAGPCLTWRDGERVTVDSFVDNAVFPMGGGLGDYRLYEVAHPETLTLPRRYPGAKSIRCMGGLHPQPVNGLARGVGVAVRDGRLTVDEAVAFFQEVMQGENGSMKGWRAGLRGMWGQVRRGENSLGSMLGTLAEGLRGKHPPYVGGLLAQATGTKDGKRVTVMRRTPRSGSDTYLWDSMGSITGTSCAAFMTLALGREERQAGVAMPEDWVEPQSFYRALEGLGAPREEVIDDVEITAGE